MALSIVLGRQRLFHYFTKRAEQNPLELIVLVTLSDDDPCISHPSDVSQDAFPPNFVRQNRFRRQATLLVTLSDDALVINLMCHRTLSRPIL